MTSLVLVTVVAAFMVLDASSPELHGIEGWRIGAIVPALLFLVYALAVFPRLQKATVPLHALQLAGLMVMMCGISSDLATRPDFPLFGRTALISSLLVCVFADFALAGGARSWLALILLPPLAAMGIHITQAGAALTAIEKTWLISNPTALALGLSVIGLYQERAGRKEHRTRAELRLSEEALRASEHRHRAELETMLQRLQFVMAASRTGLDIVDEDYIVQYVDPARFASLGDPTGRKCYEYFRGLSVPCSDCAMRTAFATRQVQVREQPNPRDPSRPTQVTAIPYRSESGRWMVAEVEVDISERKQAEAERLEWERRAASSRRMESLGILAGGVAHHFNNLLTVILGHADLLRGMLPADPSPRSSLQEIIRAGQRSRDLVQQLLALGHAQPLERRYLDLNEIVRQREAALRAALRQGTSLVCALCPQTCPVHGDAARLGEALVHLVLNAQDAIAGEGRIEISTIQGEAGPQRESGTPLRWVTLCVSDTGSGMDRDTADRVFDPFFTTKEPGKGTGLGLPVVRAIVEQHQGAIEVESRPGAGTRILIYLPVAEAGNPG